MSFLLPSVRDRDWIRVKFELFHESH